MGQITTGIRAALSSPWVYDAFQWLMGSRAARTEFTERVVRPPSRARILDVGCGTGDLLAFLPTGAEYWGWDVSRAYINAARARFGSRGHFVSGLITEADVMAMPPFDLVIACGVLHHLDDDAATTLLRLGRMALRHGGRFVSLDCAVVPGQNPMARLLIDLDRGQNVRHPEGYLDLARPVFDRVDGVLRHRAWVPYTYWMMEAAVAGEPGRDD